ncbi:G-type lectin S-receptor-like serine/threonine-protein kinase At5g35370 [Lolium rigidum]|uniref:G-type lectin S-receptor-like serine/threonine-protein kinase At5g35370 n=1 Tax=Lolium rigidum TaxID=89674 RepID=UPI001F5E34E3|nr:G-type lectin S-receptor-like serine/threonine-protein kinase At5g35370 [Lolium rigidum]
MGTPSPMPPLLLLSLILGARHAADASTVSTEVITPDFSASYLLFIDTYGVFLRSRSGAFEAAVYNPGGQHDRYYLAVLHAPSKTCVWAANRAAPITDNATPVRLTSAGLAAENANGTAVWSTPTFSSPVAALRLDDYGNLALLDADNATLWQSFDRPTDSLVSSQSLPAGGSLASAASASDMDEGPYRLNVTTADAVLSWSGSLYWRLSNDAISVKDRDGTVAHMTVNGTGIYLLAADGAVIIRVAMAPAELRIVQLGVDGKLRISSFASANASASPMDGGIVSPSRGCDLPLSCGALGLCTPNGNATTCTCPRLFATSHDNGCAPSDVSTSLPAGSCGSAGGAGGSLAITYLPLGSGIAYYGNKFSPPAVAGSNASSCQKLCTGNCSCLGYFYDDSSRSCYLAQHQLGSFISTNATSAAGMSGYIKVQSSQSPSSSSGDSSSSNKTLVAILLPTVIAFVLIVVVGAIVIVSWRKKERRAGRRPSGPNRDVQLRRQPRSPGSASAHLVRDLDSEDDADDFVIPGLPTRFTHQEIEDMTNSYRTKIGAGGFGAVYKGELPDGSLVAVKRIEGVGTQGKREFCTEIAVIGNIHHVNLVRLRGFCTEGQRRLLVYEYMNRGSLDRPLFRPTGPLLEWKERVDIAVGAARGLAYLHFGCNQRIIHCDVKPENILLADGGQVKIADFGLAKFLTPEQSGLFTTMRGTRGYLAPEWLTNTAITDRTDVYGFGMVLLELVHGRKNRSEHVSDGTGGGEDSIINTSSGGTAGSSSRSSRNDYFPLVALEGHEAGRYTELADARLEGRVVAKEVERMVKVALCCLHEDPQTRPSMAVVAGMLEGTMELREPRAQALGFLRLYGRGFAGPSDGNIIKQVIVSGAVATDRIRSEATMTTMSGWPSYMSSTQLSEPR